MKQLKRILVLLMVLALSLSVTSGAIAEKSSSGKLTTATFTVAKKSAGKQNVTVSIPRGGSIKLWYWYNGSGGYDMRNGNSVTGILFHPYANSNITVKTDAWWISLKKTSNKSFSFSMKNNLSSVNSRVGTIKIYDNRGKVATYKIYQAAYMQLDWVYQKSSRTVDVDWLNMGAVSGYKVYRGTSSSTSSMKCISTVSSKVYGVHYKSLTKGMYYYYRVRPIRKMGTRIAVGPYSTAWGIRIK